MILIGLTGFAGAGKDLVATLLQEAHGAQSFRLAFADKLRAEVCEAYGCPIELLTDSTLKNLPSPAMHIENCQNPEFREFWARTFPPTNPWRSDPSPRVVMQTWGDYRRQQSSEYFVFYAAGAWRKAEDDGAGLTVVTDTRFANEALTLCTNGGTIWRVSRPGVSAVNSHNSETSLGTWPVNQLIVNDGDVSLLRKKVRDLYYGEIGKRAWEADQSIRTARVAS